MKPTNRSLLKHIRRLLELARDRNVIHGRMALGVHVIETSRQEVAELLQMVDAELAEPEPRRFEVEVVEAGTYQESEEGQFGYGAVTLNGRIEDLAGLALGRAVLEVS